jgi:hypothetical protein
MKERSVCGGCCCCQLLLLCILRARIIITRKESTTNTHTHTQHAHHLQFARQEPKSFWPGSRGSGGVGGGDHFPL